MSHVFLAAFLIVFGLNMLLGLALPIWLTGLLAITAGTILLFERFNVRINRRP